MTTQVVTGLVQLSDGSIVDLKSTLTDATSSEVQTSGVVGSGGGIAATSIGTYANGKTIVAFIQPISASGQVQWAYLERRGSILAILPTGSSEEMNEPMAVTPIQLQAGDTIQCLTGAATADIRQVNYNVICTDGTQAIFSGQPGTGTSGATSLTHILSGQGIGQSLSGRSVQSHWATGTEGARYAGGSVLLVNDRGLPQGATVVVSVNKQPMRANSSGRAQIQLNWQVQAVLIA
jgi:hypothetical protein